MSKPIDVPLEVIEALEEVRSEGRYNMYGSTDVVNRMSDLGHYKAFLWMIDMDRFEHSGDVKVNNDKYMAALFDLGQCKGLASEED